MPNYENHNFNYDSYDFNNEVTHTSGKTYFTSAKLTEPFLTSKYSKSKSARNYHVRPQILLLTHINMILTYLLHGAESFLRS